MAYDPARFARLCDEILTLRALMSGLRERLDGPRQVQLQLINRLSRAQTTREARAGAPLPEGVTIANIMAEKAKLRTPSGYHRRPDQLDFDAEIVELRAQKAEIDHQVAALDTRMRECSERLRALTGLRQVCEAWATAAGVSLPGAGSAPATVSMPPPAPYTRQLRDETVGLPIEDTRR